MFWSTYTNDETQTLLMFSVCEEGGDSWRYSLRPCCESAFLSVFHEFREDLTPVLVGILNDHSGSIPPGDLQAILRKDAVYNAVGLAAFDLYDEVGDKTACAGGCVCRRRPH